MSHTKEPWIVNGSIRIESEHEHGIVNDGWIIGDLSGPDAKENARRIVACVNACEKFKTEDLEKYPIISDLVGNAIKEREQLRELCGELIPLLSTMTSLVLTKYGNLDKDIYAEIEKSKELITKAERVLGGE